MPSSASLDAIIKKHAIEFAEHVRAAAKSAGSEMDVQVEAASQLKAVGKAAGIKLHEAHNHTIAEGRPDSVYNRVIVEYKNPASPSERIGSSLDAAGSKKVVEQIKDRFRALQTELGHSIESLFGVACDGNRFIFVRWRDKKWEVQPPVEVDQHSAERFLWALFNLGTKGNRPYTPEYLAGDFGADSPLAQNGIRVLYEAILAAKHAKAVTFFKQWRILFGEVSGYDVDDPSDKVKKLAGFYGVRGKPHPAELLFAVHTYYAVFMKLVAAGIVVRFHGLSGDPASKLHAATHPTKFKEQMEELEKGAVFRHFNITNFLEGDLFAWYLPEWSKEIHGFLKAMVDKLDNYNPQTLAEEPTRSRDLLKKLYQELFPKSVRHDLGEYYTPDWLAEHVLNEVGYDGDPDKRILDPACGSGTFLVLAINRIRKWYEQHRGEKGVGYEEADLCRKILANCIGFDLNPLAVMAARTNYLIAIRGLISGLDKIEIPVYLCDSILTPSAYGGLFAGDLSAAKEIKTAAANFIIPTEIARSRDDVTRYADALEFCIRNGYSPKDFLARCESEGLPVTKDRLHSELYKELVDLDKANENGVWARIIKNSFAPLFVGRVDFVAGNPPWIRWGYLPEDYRDSTKALWTAYGLFSLRGAEAQLGSGEKDFSQLFTYACIDHYLSPGARLGFVITQTVFKAKGQSQGFRRFRLGERETFSIDRVDDWVVVRPFEAGNLTTTFVATKNQKTRYPVSYVVWLPKPGVTIDSDCSLEQVKLSCNQEQQAALPMPGDSSNQWLTASARSVKAIGRVLGSTLYQAQRGAGTDPYSVFQVRPLRSMGKSRVFIENHYDAPRAKVRLDRVEATVETELLWPICRGEDIGRWCPQTSVWIIMTHNPATRLGILPATMRQKYTGALDYIRQFERQLKARRSKFVRSLMARSGYWSMYGISERTVAEHKVMWRRMGSRFIAGVAQRISGLGGMTRVQVPSDTVSFVACDTTEAAHYLCALLNSTPVRRAVRAFSAPGRGFGAPAILKHLNIKTYDDGNKQHRLLAQSSVRLHETARDRRPTEELERELDDLAASVWGLSSRELLAMQEELALLDHTGYTKDDELEEVEE